MASNEKLQPLNLSHDAIATYQDWLAWKRSLLYYLEAKEITDSSRKKAVLLHQGGRPLQEIYATIEASDSTAAKASKDKDPFEFTMTALDSHFKPSTNKFYERFLFRRIRQESDSLDQFLVRLRKQVVNCSFSDVSDALIDQIIEGTSNPDFQHKILEQRLQKLPQVIELGKLLETVKVQSSAYSSGRSPAEESVARLQTQRSARSTDDVKTPGPGGSRRCFRCGSSTHSGQDQSCPAREATCFKCDKTGHFAGRCRSRFSASAQSSERRTLPQPGVAEKTSLAKSTPARSAQKVRALDSNAADLSSDEDANCFRLASPSATAAFSNRVPLWFGKFRVAPVVDSGADRNLMAAKLWEELRRKGLEFVNVPVDVRVYPYGRTAPIRFQCAVRFTVSSESASVAATFYVVDPSEGDCETIVGRVLGIKLKVLRIGREAAVIRHLCIKPPASTKLGKLTGVALSIPLNPAVKPLSQPCRRVPFALREKIKSHLQELIDDDIIEEVRDEPTPWVSPIVPVIKKNGKLRLCVDMRRANEAVLRENFPIPTFEELLANMVDCEIFSKIDLSSAYNQVELSPESRVITTFVTPDGIFRFKRLYCGIRCAPEIFQRLMSTVIQDLPNVKVFFDDIIVYSRNRADHERHVKLLLQRLEARGLSINLEKSVFGVSEVEFLGHKVTKNKIKPNSTNAEAIQAFHPPENKKDLQSFLGLMNYVARFIPDYSSLTAPLRALLGNQTPFVWTAKHSQVFESLKKAITDVELAIFDPNATILLYADASPVALGAVLMQRRAHNAQPEILAFASRSLSKPEQNYSQIEREALGIVWACERFRLYTFGKNFELFTDHRPLEILFGPKSKPNARIERWVLRLQSFDYTIRYIQGPKNLADPFSRLGHSVPNNRSYTSSLRVAVRAMATEAVPVAISLEEFRAKSRDDAEISAVVRALRSDSNLPEQFMKVRFELTFVDDLLLRGDRLVPPKLLRARILAQAHEGHPGVEIMKRRLRSKVWWPHIDSEAERFAKSCVSCIAVGRIDPPEPMKRTELPTGPWEYVAVDHLGPLPDGRHILVIVDYFSRFLDYQFTKSTTASETIMHLSQIFARFGYPAKLKSDNGPAFSSNEFRDFLQEYGVEHITSPPLWPRANGEVERQNRSILKRLKIAAVERKNANIELAKYVLLYHSTPHSSTGVSPAELMFQRRIRDKLPSLANPSPLYADIRDRDAESKSSGKNYADRKRGLTGPERKFSVGDTVLIQTPKLNKLTPTFDPDPFQVVATSPGEVVVRRGTQTLRRSSSAVKQLPQQTPNVASDIPPTPQKLQTNGGEVDESAWGSPFKGFPEQASVEAPSSASTNQPTITRSGRVVNPPSRYEPKL